MDRFADLLEGIAKFRSVWPSRVVVEARRNAYKLRRTDALRTCRRLHLEPERPPHHTASTMAANSLNSVVSSLVRASMGSSVPSMVTDEELDRHVQELILKEAKKKAEQYSERGVRAYLPE